MEGTTKWLREGTARLSRPLARWRRFRRSALGKRCIAVVAGCACGGALLVLVQRGWIRFPNSDADRENTRVKRMLEQIHADLEQHKTIIESLESTSENAR